MTSISIMTYMTHMIIRVAMWVKSSLVMQMSPELEELDEQLYQIEDRRPIIGLVLCFLFTILFIACLLCVLHYKI